MDIYIGNIIMGYFIIGILIWIPLSVIVGWVLTEIQWRQWSKRWEEDHKCLVCGALRDDPDRCKHNFGIIQ